MNINENQVKYLYTCHVGLAIQEIKLLLLFTSAGLQISALYIHKFVIYITIKCFNLTNLTETHKNFHISVFALFVLLHIFYACTT